MNGQSPNTLQVKAGNGLLDAVEQALRTIEETLMASTDVSSRLKTRNVMIFLDTSENLPMKFEMRRPPQGSPSSKSGELQMSVTITL